MLSSAYGPPLLRDLSDFAENRGGALQNGGWFQGFVDPPRARDDISTRLTPVEPDCGRTIRDKGERGSNRYLARIQVAEMVNPIPIQVQQISGQSKTQGTTFKAQLGSLSWVLSSQWVDGGGIALIAANALHLYLQMQLPVSIVGKQVRLPFGPSRCKNFRKHLNLSPSSGLLVVY